MNGMNKIIKAALGIVFLFVSIAAIWSDDIISSFGDSGNWAAGNTSYLSLDEYSGTSSRLGDGEEYGWIEYEFGVLYRVAGIFLDVSIPEDAWLSVAYDDEGIRSVIPSSFRTDTTGEIFIDFAEYGVFTDAITVIVQGPAADDVEIYDFEISPIGCG